MSKNRKFTEKDYKTLEALAAVRLPMEQIATILGFTGQVAFARHLKKDALAREKMIMGRASASGQVRQTLYSMAMNGKHKDQFNALKWWTQTQEGFKAADSIEITGANGGPVKVKDMSKQQIEEAAIAMAKKLALTADE